MAMAMEGRDHDDEKMMILVAVLGGSLPTIMKSNGTTLSGDSSWGVPREFQDDGREHSS